MQCTNQAIAAVLKSLSEWCAAPDRDVFHKVQRYLLFRTQGTLSHTHTHTHTHTHRTQLKRLHRALSRPAESARVLRHNTIFCSLFSSLLFSSLLFPSLLSSS